MKKAIILILAIALSSGLNAQRNTELAKQAAGSFLTSLAKNVTADNFKMFGLTSPDEAKLLVPGQVFASQVIGLEDIRKYNGGEVKPLLTNVDRFLCTAINQRTQQTVGVVELEYQKENYVVKGFSSSDLSNALGRIDKQLFTKNFSIVRVPALNTYFGSFTDTDNQLKFVSLQNNPTLNAEVGTVRPAADFLKLLVPVANEYNGLPW